MAINSVDMDRALNSASYAQQALRSGKVTAEQKGQLVAKWGAQKVQQWSSVDGTEYEIDDVSYDKAKEAGKEETAKSVGYNGSKNYRAVADTAISAGGAVVARTVASKALGGVGAKILGTKATAALGNAAAEKVGAKLGSDAAGKAGGKALGKVVSDFAAVAFASAEVAHYLVAKPNKDQHDAAMKLMESELPQGETSLCDAQSNMADATAEVTELSEQAAELNEETNDQIEEDKTLFDFYRTQFDALKAKAESGVALTTDEKSLMKQLAPMMEDIGTGIDELSEETTENVEDLYGDIEGYQEAYDEAGETIAEVEGMTDYAEGFDETTRTMCYVEAAAQGINAASAYAAAGRLTAKGIAATIGGGVFFAAAAVGGIAGAASTKFVINQTEMAKEVDDEIHARRAVQELGTNTTEIYGEELDNFAGNMEAVEDLELEIPEDLEVPEEPVTANAEGEQGGSMMQMAAKNNEKSNAPASPLTAGTDNNGQNNTPASPLTAGTNNNEQSNTPASPLVAGDSSAAQTKAPESNSNQDEEGSKANPNKKKEDVK